MEQTFFSVFILLFLVTDPLGNIPIAIAVLQRVPPERRRRVILREVAIAYGILLAFMFFGRDFLRLLHLSESSLGIAGGVILFLIALRMIFPSGDGSFGGKGADEPFIVPLAVPCIAGPSALATVLLISGNAPARMTEWIGALTLALLVVAIILSSAERIRRLLGERALIAFERLMGLILTAMAVEMLLAGVRKFAMTL
ncbi:MAG TPA: MarC family protein [Chthoniobacteraceae bacterium]|nr:MarC family protein [Chthoniobacteraceae bacterium]